MNGDKVTTKNISQDHDQPPRRLIPSSRLRGWNKSHTVYGRIRSIHMYIRRRPSKCLTTKGSLLFIIMSLCIIKPTKWRAPSEYSDQPEHSPSLIRVFAVHVKKAWVLGYSLNVQQRLIRLGWCPGWFESSMGAQVILLGLWCGGSYMSHVTTKPAFGVCVQLRLKPDCSATETSLGLEITAIVSRGFVLSRQWTTKTGIILCGCACWSSVWN